MQKIWTPSIFDLYATKLNKKCTKFISWKRDPKAFNIDASTIDCRNSFLYAFLPPSMILKTLRKIVNDEVSGIVIVPFGLCQPCYPLFMQLLKGNLSILTQTLNDSFCFQDSTPYVESTYPGTAAVIREAFEKQSLSNDIIEALISSLSVNSFKQYNCAYKNGGSTVNKKISIIIVIIFHKSLTFFSNHSSKL